MNLEIWIELLWLRIAQKFNMLNSKIGALTNLSTPHTSSLMDIRCSTTLTTYADSTAINLMVFG